MLCEFLTHPAREKTSWPRPEFNLNEAVLESDEISFRDCDHTVTSARCSPKFQLTTCCRLRHSSFYLCARALPPSTATTGQRKPGSVSWLSPGVFESALFVTAYLCCCRNYGQQTTARARATIGVPTLLSRTPCNTATFHLRTTFVS